MEGQGSPPNPRAAPSLAAVPGAAATVPGGSGDCFSLLPDHLLSRILIGLRTKDAVKTSALSQRWRSVWTQLCVLNFDGVESSVPASTLAAYKAHGEFDIHKLIVSPSQVNAQDTTECLSRAAHLVSGRLFFDNRRTVTPEKRQLFLYVDDEEVVMESGAVELACFKKASEIWLDLGFLGLRLPPTGVFDALKVMWLGHFWCRGQFSISDTMLPSLQALTICRVRGLVVLTLNSKSLLYLYLSVLPQSQQLNILARGLHKLEATGCFYVPGSVASIAAERLEILRWDGPCVPKPVCLREMPHLRLLGPPPITTLWPEHICAEFLNCFPAVDHLELDISLGRWMNGSPLLMEDITIPYVNVLWLYLETNGHVFEGRVLQLLTKSPCIRVLNLSFEARDEVHDFCLPDCICHNEPGIWRANVVPIMTLGIVSVANFHGAPREVYFVKQVVLRAPRLKLLRIMSKVQDHSLDGIGGICPAGCVFEVVVVPG